MSLRATAKAAYGFGLAAEGIKTNAFTLFLLFYYQQIVGLDPSWCGLALFIALCVDAVTDPIVGVWSDGHASRFGRRHPFMYASTIPLCVCYLAVFMPPEGMSTVGQFCWLTVFAVGTRFSMTLFAIPHQSLVPELTHDYDERTSLQSFRTVFAWLFGIANALLAYTVFLAATEQHPHGLLNPSGYPKLAVFGAVVMLVSTFVSSRGTQKAALDARRDDDITKTELSQLPGEIRRALQNDSYRATVLGGLCLFVGFGLTENLRNYVNTYFWEFTSEQIGAFVPVLFLSSIVVLASAKRLARRYGKRAVILVSVLLPGVVGPSMVALRMFDILPANGDPKLLPILMFAAFWGTGGSIMAMTMLGALVADVTDEHELDTGKRQEGLLFSANAFLIKAASGVGILVASQVVRFAAIPEGAKPDAVAPDVVHNLGLFAACGAMLFAGSALMFLRGYALTRQRHSEIVAQLIR